MAIFEIQTEMRDRGAEIFALYFDSIAGYGMLSNHLEEWKKSIAADVDARFGIKVDQDTWKVIEPLKVPAPHGKADRLGEFTRSLVDYRMRLSPDGRNALLIGNYLLIALYQFWEDSWRGRIADALKLTDKNLIVSDFWGDLRLMRICLIHKKGIANPKAENDAKEFRWFKEGDAVVIDPAKVERIIEGFFRFLYGELVEYESKLLK